MSLSVLVEHPRGPATAYNVTILELGREYRLESADGGSDYVVELDGDHVTCDCPAYHYSDGAGCKHIRAVERAGLLRPSPRPTAAPSPPSPLPVMMEHGAGMLLRFASPPSARVMFMLGLWGFRSEDTSALDWAGPRTHRTMRQALGLARLIATGKLDPA